MSKFIRNSIIIILGLGTAAAVFVAFQPEKSNERTAEPNNYEQGGQETYVRDGATMQKYRNADLGFSFEYRVVPDGYTLIGERDVGPDNSISEYSLNLFDTADYLGAISSTAPRDGPISISVRIFENKENLSPLDWAKANPRESWYDLARTPLSEMMLGGAEAVTYEADGLYVNDVYVVNNNFIIYIIDAPKLAPEHKIKKDFEKFLESLLFF